MSVESLVDAGLPAVHVPACPWYGGGDGGGGGGGGGGSDEVFFSACAHDGHLISRLTQVDPEPAYNSYFFYTNYYVGACGWSCACVRKRACVSMLDVWVCVSGVSALD